jgi:GNAT superfamily N-acetyltransferase
VIRPPHPDEGERLREIAAAAKAYWGYDIDQVRRWAAEADFSTGKDVLVAEEGGRAVGFASVLPQGEAAVLDDLWVEPDAIGTGLGRLLFDAAVTRARELGARTLEWEAEPNAVGFYERMGGRYVRDSEPSEWGRILPVMAVEL